MPDGRVPPVRVVPPFDVAEDRNPGLGLRVKDASVQKLALESGKEVLSHRVVVRVTDRAARRSDAHLTAALPEGQSRVNSIGT